MRAIILTTPEVQQALTGAVQMQRRVKGVPVGADYAAYVVESTRKRDTGSFAFMAGAPPAGRMLAHIHAPFGEIGERAWVRETWNVDRNVASDSYALLYYRAGNMMCETDGLVHDVPYETCAPWEGPWRSPVTMPRWASRLTLELTAVRVERDGDTWWWVTDWRRV